MPEWKLSIASEHFLESTGTFPDIVENRCQGHSRPETRHLRKLIQFRHTRMQSNNIGKDPLSMTD